MPTARAIIPAVRAEDGYEQYAVRTAKEQPGAFAFSERWSSGQDIARHGQQPHMQDYFGKPVLHRGDPFG